MSDPQYITDQRAADVTYEAALTVELAAQVETQITALRAMDTAMFNSWSARFATHVDSAVTDLTAIMNSHAVIFVPRRAERVAALGARIRARNAVLLGQFALTRPPEDIARLSAVLENNAIIATAAFAGSLAAQATAILTSALDRAADETPYDALLANQQAQFEGTAEISLMAFRAAMTESNGLFMLVLHLSGVEFLDVLSAQLQGPDPPTEAERDALVEQRTTDRAQVVLWTKESIDAQAAVIRVRKQEENVAQLAEFDRQDLLNYRMNGQPLDQFFLNGQIV